MATPPHVSAVRPSAVTLVTQTRVSPSHDAEFARWQEQVNHALAHFPGYLDHTVLPPHPPARSTGSSCSALRAMRRRARGCNRNSACGCSTRFSLCWSGRMTCTSLRTTANRNCSRLSRPSSPRACSQGKKRPSRSGNAGLRRWKPRSRASVATGSSRRCPGGQDHWMTMLRFDSDAHLDAWLNSEQRQQLLAETPRFSFESHTRKVHTRVSTPGSPAARGPRWSRHRLGSRT
jgi:uncharacterized protein